MSDDNQETTVSDEDKRNYLPYVAIALGIFLLWVVFVMAVNSRKPELITLKKGALNIKGSQFVRVNQLLIKKMHENWIPNDIFWPTVLLDNLPNFQIGELEVVRYNARVLRDNLSRMRTTDRLDAFAEETFTSLSNDPYKWWFPSAESKWKIGDNNLNLFSQNLQTGKSNFYPRADNLVQLLDQYVSLMGGANTRLINAPRDIKKTLSLEESNKGATATPALVDIDIPWRKIDDNFYYAQGVAYALQASFQAIRMDFMDVLVDKNSLNLVNKILEDLGRCHFEPLVVTNGNPQSIFANHSLNLAGVFNDARQKISSLISALKQG